jgi:hypothetical protein
MWNLALNNRLLVLRDGSRCDEMVSSESDPSDAKRLEGDNPGDIVARAAAVLLPHFREAPKLRFRGALKRYAFVDLLLQFVATLLTGEGGDADADADSSTSVLRLLASRHADVAERQSESRGRNLASALLLSSSSEAKPISWADTIAVLQASRTVIEILFAAATATSGSAEVTWDDWIMFLLDSAISCNVARFTADPFFFVPQSKTPFTVACSHFRLATPDTAIIVQQHNVTSPAEGILARVSTAEVLERSPWPHSVTQIEPIPARRLVACCADLVVFFMDNRTISTFIGELTLDQLGDAPSTIYNSERNDVLYCGTRGGQLLELDAPKYKAKTGAWAAAAVAHRIPLRDMKASVVTITESAAPHTLFLLSAHGDLMAYSTMSRAVLSVVSCKAHGLQLCTGMVYNRAADLLVCAGESPHLLCWAARNAPDQTPIVLEDRGAPHGSRVQCLAVEPAGLSAGPTANATAIGATSYTVISMDGQGMLKVWNLASLEATQTIRLLLPSIHHLVHVALCDRRLIVVTKSEFHVYRIDDTQLYSPVNGLVGHPAGMTVAGAVGPDILEWSCANGRKTAHHQRIADSTIRFMRFNDDGSLIFLLAESGTVSIHSAATAKRLGSHSATVNFAGTDALDLQYCSATKRLVVPTVDNEIVLLPALLDSDGNLPQAAVRGALMGGDSSCTCVAVGKLDSGTTAYIVGTSENTVQVFVCRTATTVEATTRVCLPSILALPGLQPPSAAGGPSGVPSSWSVGLGGSDTTRERAMLASLASPQVTAIYWCPSNIICADSTGAIHVYLNRGFRFICTSTFLQRVGVSRRISVSNSGGGLASPRGSAVFAVVSPPALRDLRRSSSHATSVDGSTPTNAGGTAATNRARYVTSVAPLIVGVFLVFGDCLGGVTVCRLDRKRDLVVMEHWNPHSTAVTAVAVENDCVISTGTNATLLCSSMRGDHLGSWWGPTQAVAPVKAPPVSWLDEFDARESASTIQISEGAVNGGDASMSSSLLGLGAAVHMARKKMLRRAQQHGDKRLIETIDLTAADKAALVGVRNGSDPATTDRASADGGTLSEKLLANLQHATVVDDEYPSALPARGGGGAGPDLNDLSIVSATKGALGAAFPETLPNKDSPGGERTGQRQRSASQIKSALLMLRRRSSAAPSTPGGLTPRDGGGGGSSLTPTPRGAMHLAVPILDSDGPAQASTTHTPRGTSGATTTTLGLLMSSSVPVDWRASVAQQKGERSVAGQSSKRPPRILAMSNESCGLPAIRSRPFGDVYSKPGGNKRRTSAQRGHQHASVITDVESPLLPRHRLGGHGGPIAGTAPLPRLKAPMSTVTSSPHRVW